MKISLIAGDSLPIEIDAAEATLILEVGGLERRLDLSFQGVTMTTTNPKTGMVDEEQWRFYPDESGVE